MIKVKATKFLVSTTNILVGATKFFWSALSNLVVLTKKLVTLQKNLVATTKMLVVLTKNLVASTFIIFLLFGCPNTHKRLEAPTKFLWVCMKFKFLCEKTRRQGCITTKCSKLNIQVWLLPNRVSSVRRAKGGSPSYSMRSCKSPSLKKIRNSHMKSWKLLRKR